MFLENVIFRLDLLSSHRITPTNFKVHIIMLLTVIEDLYFKQPYEIPYSFVFDCYRDLSIINFKAPTEDPQWK